MWNLHQFYAAVSPLLPQYVSDNRWFSWRTVDRDEHIFDAWRLYKEANRNALGLLLLGDAKIRRNGELLRNFGVTSGNGLSDEHELQQIRDLERARTGLAGPRSGATPKVLGPGSILNDKQWTPLLNDAFILGGVHGNQDFHWAEEGFQQHALLGEREFLQRRDVFGAAAPQYAAALKRDEAYYKGQWRHYLLGKSNFWGGGLVRVFARELIGLKSFGYSPTYSSSGLFFSPSGGRSTATFGAYLQALRAVNFQNMDSVAINAALGEFLFGDSNALSNLSTGQAPKPPGQHLLKASPKPPGWPK